MRGTRSEATDAAGLFVVIETTGAHLLTMTGHGADLCFVPVFCGPGGPVAFLPVVGETMFKISAHKAPVELRFQAADLSAASLTPYTVFDAVRHAGGRRLAQHWAVSKFAGLKTKLVAFKCPPVGIAADLSAAVASSNGPCSTFAKEHPPVVVGWPEQHECAPWQPVHNSDSGIMVTLHLSDSASWSEFDRHLGQMPVPFRLLVTSPRRLPAETSAAIVARFPGAELIEAGEHGGATAAFFELLDRGAFEGIDYICRFSDAPPGSKATAFSSQWVRRIALITLLADAARIESSLAKLAGAPGIGMVGPVELRDVAIAAPGPADKRDRASVALMDWRRRIGLGDGVEEFEYFSGGNFWVRVRALEALRDLNLSDADFARWSPADAVLHAEAVEQLFCRAVRRSGFSINDIPDGEPTTAAVGRAVTAAAWRDHVAPTTVGGRQVCLFASYLPDGRFSDAALYYMRALRQAGFYLHALAAVPDVNGDIVVPDATAADAVSIRANEGYDFALWAAALERHPGYADAAGLLLANDSVFGPLRSMTDIVGRLQAIDADFIGMTENLEIQRHFQSYFLYFKPLALHSVAFKRFWRNVRSQPNKANLIRAYEVPMLAKLEAAGLRGAVLFPTQSHWHRPRNNPTIHAWQDLAKAGFPFLKAELLRDNPGKVDLSGWRAFAAAEGYDVGLIERLFAARWPGAVALGIKE